jgi:hypothetical protein
MHKIIVPGLLMGLAVMFLNSTCATTSGDAGIPYTDLGKIQVEFGQSLDIAVPYDKPEGITKIPTAYYWAFVLHELRADGKRIFPKRLYPIWWLGADDTYRGYWIADTIQEAEYLTLELDWEWAEHYFTQKEGLYLPEFSRGDKKYTLPYGAKEISLIYSIRFVTYDPQINAHELTELGRAGKFGVKWTLEWLPPAE